MRASALLHRLRQCSQPFAAPAKLAVGAVSLALALVALPWPAQAQWEYEAGLHEAARPGFQPAFTDAEPYYDDYRFSADYEHDEADFGAFQEEPDFYGYAEEYDYDYDYDYEYDNDFDDDFFGYAPYDYHYSDYYYDGYYDDGYHTESWYDDEDPFYDWY